MIKRAVLCAISVSYVLLDNWVVCDEVITEIRRRKYMNESDKLEVVNKKSRL